MTRPAAQRQIALERLAEFRRLEAEKMAKAAAAAVEATDTDGDAYAPLPMLPGYRLHHAGEFDAVGQSGPCVPMRRRIVLGVAGLFVGCALLELSRDRGRTWSPLLSRVGEPATKATAGKLCIGFLAVDGRCLVRARCLQLVSGRMVWSISTW